MKADDLFLKVGVTAAMPAAFAGLLLSVVGYTPEVLMLGLGLTALAGGASMLTALLIAVWRD